MVAHDQRESSRRPRAIIVVDPQPTSLRVGHCPSQVRPLPLGELRFSHGASGIVRPRGRDSGSARGSRRTLERHAQFRNDVARSLCCRFSRRDDS